MFYLIKKQIKESLRPALKLKYRVVTFFLRERECTYTSEGRGRGREREKSKQVPCSAQSPTWDSHSFHEPEIMT